MVQTLLDNFALVPGKKGEVPLRVRESFFDVANKRIEELVAHGESETEIGKRWGISQNMVNRIKARTGGLGIKTLYGMRKDLGKSIDEILGLPAFEAEVPGRSTVRPKSGSLR